MARDLPRRRRVEAGLDVDLASRRDIGPSERAALRSVARAIDVAEADHNPDVVARVNAVYLEMRQACGLTSGAAQPADSFSALLAELGRASPFAEHPPNPGPG